MPRTITVPSFQRGTFSLQRHTFNDSRKRALRLDNPVSFYTNNITLKWKRVPISNMILAGKGTAETFTIDIGEMVFMRMVIVEPDVYKFMYVES